MNAIKKKLLPDYLGFAWILDKIDVWFGDTVLHSWRTCYICRFFYGYVLFWIVILTGVFSFLVFWAL
jgi:hypothetical protein